MGKVYAALAAIGGVLAAVLYAFAKGAESAENKAKAKSEEAKAKSYERQAKAAQKRQAKARKRIDEAKSRDFTADDVNSLYGGRPDPDKDSDA